MFILRKIDQHLEEWICILLMGVMCIITLWQIISRTAGWTVMWQEEVSRYLFVWIIYMGCARAVKERKHIRVDVILMYLNRKGKLIFDLIGNVLIFILAVIVIYAGQTMIGTSFARGQISPAMAIPMWIPQSSFFVGFILVALRVLQDTYKLIVEYIAVRHEPEPSKEVAE